MASSDLNTRVKSCTKCPLHKCAIKIVPGEGPIPAEYMLVGEAPGREEDELGLPFRGMAGKETDKLLVMYARIARSEMRVENVIHCRPPRNRDPFQDEIESCRDWLTESLELTMPRIVIAAGAVAAKWFLGKDFDLQMGHGRPYQVADPWGDETHIIPVFHPALGIHEPRKMRLIQQDFINVGKFARGELELPQDEFLDTEYEEVS